MDGLCAISDGIFCLNRQTISSYYFIMKGKLLSLTLTCFVTINHTMKSKGDNEGENRRGSRTRFLIRDLGC